MKKKDKMSFYSWNYSIFGDIFILFLNLTIEKNEGNLKFNNY